MRELEKILLIEDDEVDALAVKRALDKLLIKKKLIHTMNGEEAVTYILDKSISNPSIILLDLNMPIMNGLEFLEERKKSLEFSRIPTVVLTTSNYDVDLQMAYDLGASGFMVKPIDFDEFINMMSVIMAYWSQSESIS